MWPKEDEYRIPGDLPGTRRTLLQVTTKFNVFFLCILAILGGILCIGGIAMGGLKTLDAIDPDDGLVTMVLGVIVFALFFPWSMTLYFSRHLLLSVTRLEDEVARLRGAIEDESATEEEMDRQD